MQLVKAAVSSTRLPSAIIEKLTGLVFNCGARISLAVLVVVVLVFFLLLNIFALDNEQPLFADFGYREKAIAAQFPFPVHRGSPYEKDFLPGHEDSYCSLGTLEAATEKATGKAVSVLTLLPGTRKKVLSRDLQSFLRHRGLPGLVNVLAIYVQSWVTHVVLECAPRTLSPWNIALSVVYPEVFIQNLYRNVHSLLASKAVSGVNLEGANMVFNTSSVPYSDPLVLTIRDTGVMHQTEINLAFFLYIHVRSALYGYRYDGELDFIKLLQTLDSMLEPTVAIFHSQTHFNVSEVHYCFQSQLELLSPGASRLLGLYQAVFGFQELQPWKDRIIRVYHLSAFGYPAVDYNSTLDDPSWSRLFFWDEPFSVGGWDSTPFDGIHMVNLRLNGTDSATGTSVPFIN